MSSVIDDAAIASAMNNMENGNDENDDKNMLRRSRAARLPNRPTTKSCLARPINWTFSPRNNWTWQPMNKPCSDKELAAILMTQLQPPAPLQQLPPVPDSPSRSLRKRKRNQLINLATASLLSLLFSSFLLVKLWPGVVCIRTSCSARRESPYSTNIDQDTSFTVLVHLWPYTLFYIMTLWHILWPCASWTTHQGRWPNSYILSIYQVSKVIYFVWHPLLLYDVTLSLSVSGAHALPTER